MAFEDSFSFFSLFLPSFLPFVLPPFPLSFVPFFLNIIGKTLVAFFSLNKMSFNVGNPQLTFQTWTSLPIAYVQRMFYKSKKTYPKSY